MPKRGTYEILSAITRELWSHETPEKEQCGEGEDDELAFQSWSPELVEPTMEALSFNSVWRSEYAFEEENESKRKMETENM